MNNIESDVRHYFEEFNNIYLILDKNVSSSNKLLEFARLCALDVIDLWDAPQIVREYLETSNKDIREDASQAAWMASHGLLKQPIQFSACETAAWACASIVSPKSVFWHSTNKIHSEFIKNKTVENANLYISLVEKQIIRFDEMFRVEVITKIHDK